MGLIEVNQSKCDLCRVCIEACPFNAIEMDNEKVVINSACKVCKICINKCPQNAINLLSKQDKIDKDAWKGVMVYVEHLEGAIHPVTYELIGKAKELAKKINHPVYCLFIGSDINKKAQELLYYGIDKVFVYNNESFKQYRVDIYTNAFEDCINKVKPSIILVGGTSIGRSLAPRVSTRFRTGLTADCTVLDVYANTDLIQIRPAFGGNIMAQILTPNSRPQFATVRYRVMDGAERGKEMSGTIESFELNGLKMKSNIDVLRVVKKDKNPDISEADVLIVAGRGLKDKKDMSMLQELADYLGGQVAVTRPLVENGWESYLKQIGLSGRTVKPKLIITCGVSGAVQFTASMKMSENIIAINKDRNAPIFKIAHYGIVGDLYEIVPELIEKIKGDKRYAI